jgi:hypothetical protein
MTVLPMLFLAAAVAQDPAPPADPQPDEPFWQLSGEARLRGDHLSPFPLDALGTPSEQGWWASSRLIAGAEGQLSDRLGLAVELESLNGLMAGDTTSVGTVRGEDSFAMARHDHRDLAKLLPRKAKLALAGPAGALNLGFDTNHWGVGILSNDGRGDLLFGDAWRGNVAARVGGALTPFSRRTESRLRGLALLAAADLVVRDENAELFEGDRARQAQLGLLWRQPRLELGAVAAYRQQEDRLDPGRPEELPSTTRVLPLDATFAWRPLDPEADLALLLEGEVARIQGHTSRPYTSETVDGARVESLGAVLRGRLDHRPSGLSAVVEGGYASGDNDMSDDVVRSFRFHSDHGVGLLLFEQVLPLLSARSADRAADPALLAVPPAGTRYLVNQGEVSNAIYLFPALCYQPTEALELRAAWLHARSAGDLIDAYSTARAGGYNTGYDGEPVTSRHLGDELDLGLRGALDLGDRFDLLLGAEGGVFLPGAALAGLELGSPYTLRARADLRW